MQLPVSSKGFGPNSALCLCGRSPSDEPQIPHAILLHAEAGDLPTLTDERNCADRAAELVIAGRRQLHHRIGTSMQLQTVLPCLYGEHRLRLVAPVVADEGIELRNRE